MIENQKETRFITLNFDEVKEKTIRIADIPESTMKPVMEEFQAELERKEKN